METKKIPPFYLQYRYAKITTIIKFETLKYEGKKDNSRKIFRCKITNEINVDSLASKWNRNQD